MYDYHYVWVTPGSHPGPYSVYYNDMIHPNNLAELHPSGLPATDIQYVDLISGNGVIIRVPQGSTPIIIYNQLCDESQIIDVVFPERPTTTPWPTPEPTPTPTDTPVPATATPTPTSIPPLEPATATPTPTPLPATATPTPTPTITPYIIPGYCWVVTIPVENLVDNGADLLIRYYPPDHPDNITHHNHNEYFDLSGDPNYYQIRLCSLMEPNFSYVGGQWFSGGQWVSLVSTDPCTYSDNCGGNDPWR